MDSSFSLTNVVAAAISFFTLLGAICFMFFNKNFRSLQEKKTTASSLPPPPSSSLSRNGKYHVFPNFHGPDVRRTLLSHILAKSNSKGIHTFVDDDMDRSKSIGPVLIEAIRGSRIAIVFLSKNYASSPWCLDELVEIIKCRKELGQIVISLFHEVDPTDVKKQTGDFGKVFKKTCIGKTKDDTGRWKHALAEVAKIAGYHSKNWKSEAYMIEEIATDVSNKLNISTSSRDFDGLVGMESHIINMEPLLRLGSDEVRIIGILGPPGIGKTTIARFLFDRHSKSFSMSAFMKNGRARCEKQADSDDYNVKLFLQEQFMSQLTNEKGIKISHLGAAKDRLKNKKVLVVLDDVDRLVQLEAMVNETWFGPCSRIIITTQDEKLLKQSGINLIYKVDLPSPNEAFQMFDMYSFPKKYPKYDFTVLAREVIRLAGALPLGLRVMGSYFRGMSEQGWTNALQRLRTHLDGEIESILKFSYDALSVYDQSLFIHIACIFNDELVDIVEGCLANSSLFSDVAQGFCVLVEKSLLDISVDSRRITMHNLLVQLGREIVRKQSLSEPGKRQFLYDARDIFEVLNDDQAGSSSVIGIDLKENITCKSERAFERLSNLQFLRIGRHGININPRSMNYISRKLRFLSWRHFGMSCISSSFHPKYLVKLDMQESNLEKLWEETQPLCNLKWMDLTNSYRLKELPDLSTATNLCELTLNSCSSLVEFPSIENAMNLHELNLRNCSSLVKLHSSIGNAINLKKLDLTRCSSLVVIPSIGKAINLEVLAVSSCSNLEEISSSSSMENATKLWELDFSGCSSLVKLSSSIGNAYTKIKTLSFYGCSSLVKLPSYIANAVYLLELDLTDCSSLVELPSFIGNAINLNTLYLTGCSSLMELPSSIGNLINLEYLFLSYCSSLVELPSSMRNLRKLELFKLQGCSKLEVDLTNINLETLVKLNLLGCSLLKSHLETSTNIDPWIGRTSSLRELDLSGMKKMVTLPQLPGSIVELLADNCESLERLDCSFGNPDIVRLNFRNCFKLNKEARDLIIQTRTNQYAILPGEDIPWCFTYRSSGGSLTVNLKEKPLRTSTKFKACIILADEDSEFCGNAEYKNRVSEYKYGNDEEQHVVKLILCSITSKQNARTACIPKKSLLASCFLKHLYIFEVEAEEVTSTELFFEFDTFHRYGIERREIKECGVYQLSDRSL